METNLRWKALWYVDWITVNGQTGGSADGMGDGTASVGVYHARGRTEDTATTITFVYYDNDTGEEVGRKSVNVCRCILCNCEDLEAIIKQCTCESLTTWPICDCESLTTWPICDCEGLHTWEIEVCDCDDLEATIRENNNT